LNSTATQAAGTSVPPGSLLFVSDALREQVRIYDRAHETLWGKIPLTLLPGGLAVDSSRNLYVSELGGVAVYPPPYNHPNGLLATSGSQALAVAVSTTGTVAAIDAQSIYVYSGGSPQPCLQFFPPNYSQLTSVAIDNHNNIYFTGYDTSRNVAISELPAECGSSGSTQLTVSNSLRSASGIALGPDGRLSVLDTTAKTVFTYDPPNGKSLGSPVSSTPLQRGTVRTPVAFAFDASGKSIYTADSSSGVADEFAFPAGGPPTRTLTVGGQPVGIAIVPPYLPKANNRR
jgi:sugar lactone lactonase YvrE